MIKARMPWSLGLICALGAAGCATDVGEQGDATPQDSAIEGVPSAEAHLSSIWDASLPNERPYEFETIVGGDLEATMKFRGDRYTLSFAKGIVSDASEGQVIATGTGTEDETQWVTLLWPTLDFAQAASAGSSPEDDDLFSLILTSSTDVNGNTVSSQSDIIQLQLDNTPPLSVISRICLDPEEETCYATTDAPTDFNASAPPDGLIVISRSETPQLYIHGMALDRTFNGYTFRFVGGEAENETHICWADTTDNGACVGGSRAQEAGDFGYGVARDINYQETLSGRDVVNGYSDDTLLLVWDISYLSPDAYGLNLVTFSQAHISGDDDAYASSTWTTLLLTE